MEKLFYSIGEVAEALGEKASLVRYWTTYFDKFLNPRRNAKGNRMYVAEDIELLRRVHYLVKDKGMTLEGAERTLKAESRKVKAEVKVLDSLKEIRAQLKEIRAAL